MYTYYVWIYRNLFIHKIMEARLKDGVKTLIKMKFKELIPHYEEFHDKIQLLAEQLEKCCVDCALNHDHYVILYDKVIRTLSKKEGDFLESNLAYQLIEDNLTPQEWIERNIISEINTNSDPRTQGRSLIYSVLLKDPRFDSPGDKKRREYSLSIEKGCYNAVITRCIESADSYLRQWNSPMFISIYSARIGFISSNLDIDGSVIQNINDGNWALNKLADGSWDPENLGSMSEAELCPHANREVRDKINIRIGQKIDEKTSSFFACPRCRKRNHTYRQVQIGAGDEPSTFMCTCKECGENYEGYA